MNGIALKRYVGICILMIVASMSWSQYSPDFRMPLQIIETSGTTKSNYQVWFIINTSVHVQAGRMESDGADIRFANDTCLSVNYPYWIEQDMNTDTTLIWVLIDEIKANDTLDLWMFFGDSQAQPADSFAEVFPNGLVTTGNLFLTGVQDVGYLKIDTTDTIFMGPSTMLDIRARKVVIHGVIEGQAKGFAPVTPGPSNGMGPGPGGGSANGGSGGGAYGGDGGAGGYDSLATPGAAGTSVGSGTSFFIDMGSAGGSSNNTSGGWGGGAVRIDAELQTITGTINVDGGHSPPSGGPGGIRGGGGGAGGGIMLFGDMIDFSGTATLRGGNGSTGVDSTHDSGGGGGGGRFKAFWGSSYNSGSATILADSGLGGPNGEFAPGQDGTSGSVYSTNMSYDPVMTTQGNAQAHEGGLTLSTLVFTPSDPDTTICPGDFLQFTASSGFLNYEFDLNSVTVQNGSAQSWTSNTLGAGDKVRVTASMNGCYKWAEMTVKVGQSTNVNIIPSNAFPCKGDTITLSVLPIYKDYFWNTGDTSSSIVVTATDTFDIVVTDTVLCSGFDTVTVNFGGIDATISGAGPACTGDTLPLTTGAGGTTYTWSNGDTTNVTNAVASGTYTVTIIDSVQCTTTDSVTLTFDQSPAPMVAVNGDSLDAGPNMASYQWYVGGVAIAGATGQIHVADSTGNYHVEVIDSNGCDGSSGVLFIFVSREELIGPSEISLYPNPTNSELNLRTSRSDIHDCEIIFADVTGKELRRSNLSGFGVAKQHRFDVGGMKPGLYMVTLKSNAGTWYGRFVLQ